MPDDTSLDYNINIRTQKTVEQIKLVSAQLKAVKEEAKELSAELGVPFEESVDAIQKIKGRDLDIATLTSNMFSVATQTSLADMRHFREIELAKYTGDIDKDPRQAQAWTGFAGMNDPYIS